MLLAVEETGGGNRDADELFKLFNHVGETEEADV